ncbi:MAG: hypothetical protein ACRCX7_06225, partial [Cetobacterium sp.]|uniref:hypothetical protein n=1 Tax=Cetobacterium sp. TaxID=2071632 RepID=UPI003F3DD22C
SRLALEVTARGSPRPCFEFTSGCAPALKTLRTSSAMRSIFSMGITERFMIGLIFVYDLDCLMISLLDYLSGLLAVTELDCLTFSLLDYLCGLLAVIELDCLTFILLDYLCCIYCWLTDSGLFKDFGFSVFLCVCTPFFNTPLPNSVPVSNSVFARPLSPVRRMDPNTSASGGAPLQYMKLHEYMWQTLSMKHV